jgi:hypothetical protein
MGLSKVAHLWHEVDVNQFGLLGGPVTVYVLVVDDLKGWRKVSPSRERPAVAEPTSLLFASLNSAVVWERAPSVLHSI